MRKKLLGLLLPIVLCYSIGTYAGEIKDFNKVEPPLCYSVYIEHPTPIPSGHDGNLTVNVKFAFYDANNKYGLRGNTLQATILHNSVKEGTCTLTKDTDGAYKGTFIAHFTDYFDASEYNLELIGLPDYYLASHMKSIKNTSTMEYNAYFSLDKYDAYDKFIGYNNGDTITLYVGDAINLTTESYCYGLASGSADTNVTSSLGLYLTTDLNKTYSSLTDGDLYSFPYLMKSVWTVSSSGDIQERISKNNYRIIALKEGTYTVKEQVSFNGSNQKHNYSSTEEAILNVKVVGRGAKETREIPKKQVVKEVTEEGNVVVTKQSPPLKESAFSISARGLKNNTLTIKKGKSIKLKVKYKKSKNKKKNKVKYRSTNKKVFTINKKGKIRAKRKGKALAIVRVNGKTRKVKVIVN